MHPAGFEPASTKLRVSHVAIDTTDAFDRAGPVLAHTRVSSPVCVIIPLQL